MAFDLGGLLQQYLGGAAATSPQQAEAHFDDAARNAPTDVLSSGLSAMFRSDRTPPFGQMAGQMFDRSNPEQRAGMLNSMIAGLGPAVLASLAGRLGGAGTPDTPGAASGGLLGGLGGAFGGGGAGGLGGLLGQLLNGGGGGVAATPSAGPGPAPTITPEQASRISPEQVQVIAEHAEKSDPGIVDRVSDFYARHPDVVKAAGGVALAVALSKMAQHGQG